MVWHPHELLSILHQFLHTNYLFFQKFKISTTTHEVKSFLAGSLLKPTFSTAPARIRRHQAVAINPLAGRKRSQQGRKPPSRKVPTDSTSPYAPSLPGSLAPWLPPNSVDPSSSSSSLVRHLSRDVKIINCLREHSCISRLTDPFHIHSFIHSLTQSVCLSHQSGFPTSDASSFPSPFCKQLTLTSFRAQPPNYYCE